jgi:hypothetical protein
MNKLEKPEISVHGDQIKFYEVGEKDNWIKLYIQDIDYLRINAAKDINSWLNFDTEISTVGEDIEKTVIGEVVAVSLAFDNPYIVIVPKNEDSIKLFEDKNYVVRLINDAKGNKILKCKIVIRTNKMSENLSSKMVSFRMIESDMRDSSFRVNGRLVCVCDVNYKGDTLEFTTIEDKDCNPEYRGSFGDYYIQYTREVDCVVSVNIEGDCSIFFKEDKHLSKDMVKRTYICSFRK